MENENQDGGAQATADQTPQLSQEQLNADLFGHEAPEPEKAAQTAQTPDIQAQIQQAIQQALRQSLTPIQQQLGKFTKMQSEWDKQRNQTANQPPASWAQLDEATRRQTREILKAAWTEEFGKDWEALQEQREQNQKTAQDTALMNSVYRIAGKDFDDLDDIMGNIVENAKQAANQGNQDAADFLRELRETKAGPRVLVEMARAQFRGSLEQQSQTALDAQAQARKKASTAVSRPGNTQTQSTDLKSIQNIRDPKERLKALQPLMDAQAG